MEHHSDGKKEGFKKHKNDGVTHGGGGMGKNKEHSAYEEAHESPGEKKREEKMGEEPHPRKK